MFATRIHRQGPVANALCISYASCTIVVGMSETALRKAYEFNANDEESIGTSYDYCKNAVGIYTNPHE